MPEPPKPPKVDDVYRFWTEGPPEPSARCLYWLDRIGRGWVPNRRLSQMGYDSSALFFGVYVWEYVNVLSPAIHEQEILRVLR